MFTILLIAILIIVIVLLLSLLTINKAYSYKHTIDPPHSTPYSKQEDKERS